MTITMFDTYRRREITRFTSSTQIFEAADRRRETICQWTKQYDYDHPLPLALFERVRHWEVAQLNHLYYRLRNQHG
jgi:hypothetical protein